VHYFRASVRPTADELTEQDFVAKLSKGLRRLECNFDGLVRFEEVLMKKIRDSELKYSIENKRLEVTWNN
jgi:hypothetical protein